ncbi:hypothetical protein M409DRAFT_24180 [Zasmidium cellare ATCC 36951]|uniref:Uncharacterized protein n=1 Tax=Zasmidium cellare ATCC 36951 TaxID=1080233 RepID=A0A6A6CGL9_ZASCE|nr:uncharacterized protein M409DRAFT_24180 [Zasmidium cellare ATCC 36951]KAF2165330.1 hypothetical protein M409DRAFT_24180 [Zasmidium cellare ATCC 36951]
MAVKETDSSDRERERLQVATTKEMAKDERKDAYFQLISESWPADPDDWLTYLSTTNVVLKRYGVNQRPQSGRDLSVTLVKHFAVLSFWMDIDGAERHLQERIRCRRQDMNPDSKKDRYCLPSDIQWVLTNKLEGVGEGMDWEQLARDALGYQQ